MDKIIFEIKDQIYYTMVLAQGFFKEVKLSTVLLGLGFFYIFFMRKWPLKKIASFLFILFILFILMIRMEAFLFATYGKEGSFVSIGVGRLVFLIIASVIFIYNALVKE